MGSDLSLCNCVAEDDANQDLPPHTISYGLWDFNTSDLKEIQNHISTQISTIDSSETTPDLGPTVVWKHKKQIFEYVSSGNVDGLEKVIGNDMINISTLVWKVQSIHWRLIF